MCPTDKNGSVTERGAKAACTENVLWRRIGSTSYIVSVHFAETRGETIEARLIRLIESEVAKSA
ncbi:MAG: transposon-encoded TnpW family protein [Clostridiales Family XIII bacterium]|jgi:hypothetical protein|nr:transposon-encoded TnpW family protein [Clostridiales Family XIII bacterium]